MLDLASFTEEYLIYLRKSRQDDPNETVEEVLARHEKILQDYALKTFGYRIQEKNIYREVVSGETIQDRPMMQEVFKRMEAGVSGVLVVDPQRLSRGDWEDGGRILSIFKYTRTLVVTPQKTYDLNDKFDYKFFKMELSQGNEFLEYTKEILARGRLSSATEGHFVGSVCPYGYSKIKDGKYWTLVINEDEAQYVRMAFDMYANQGIGANTIAHKLNELGAVTRNGNIFRSTTIRQMLTNEVYYGMMYYKRKPVEKVMENGQIIKKRVRKKDYILVQGKHEAIISEELFKKAQVQKGKVSREKPSLELQNPYAGLIKCKKCGMAIAMRVHRKDGVETRKPRYYCRNGIYCDNKSVNVDLVQKAITEALKAALGDYMLKVEASPPVLATEHDSVVKSLESQLGDLKRRMDDICVYLEKQIYTVDMFLERKAKLEAETERVQAALKKAREYTPSVYEFEEKVSSLHKVLDMLQDDSISAKTKNNFLKEVIEVIYYEKNVNDKSTPKCSEEMNFTLDIKLK